MQGELRNIFQSPPASGSSDGGAQQSDGAVATNFADRSGQLCSRILGSSSSLHDRMRSVRKRRKLSQPSNPHKVKEFTRNLVMIDFQGQESCPLHDYQKIFDGLIRIGSDQSEEEIREEIVRLVKLKNLCTHRLELLTQVLSRLVFIVGNSPLCTIDVSCACPNSCAPTYSVLF